MYSHDMYLQTSSKMGEISRGLSRAAAAATYERVLTAVAYATERGARRVAELFDADMTRWRDIRKEWIISIDNGITEPSALEFLADLPSSSVRVPNAEAVLEAGLRPRTLFHHKVYLFDTDSDQGAVGLFSGSANLTFAGLFFNNEQATASIWTPPLRQSDRPHYENMKEQRTTLNRVFAAGKRLDSRLLERYRALWRPREYEDDTEIIRNVAEPNPVLEIPEAAALAAASSFWIEVWRETENLGRGMPGNQIDLKRGSRVFFGFGVGDVPRNSPLGTVRIRYGRHTSDCNMRFGNNSMDKLNLPVPGNPGPETYRHQTLLFQRRADGDFDMRLGSPQEIDEWKRLSRQQGTLFRMGSSGREYGTFD